MSRTIDSPSPLPGQAARLHRRGRSGRTARSRSSSAMPGAAVAHLDATVARRRPRSAAGVNLTRVLDEVRASPASSACGRHTTRLSSACTEIARPDRRTARSTTRLGDLAPGDSAIGCSSSRRSVASSTSSSTSDGQLARLALEVGEQHPPRRPAAARRSAAAPTTLVRRLVSGVRSSWPASCTSWCCSRLDRASEASIALNACPSRPVSSRPSTGTVTSTLPDFATTRRRRR